ncbi:hypothetical protein LTR09_001682 [Extremus antarcticus]|uniref:Uncharacterized protein n=1 Tax=Extremus antarcticus TaxID=702011 RepID=A0AAJ0LW85_9PEZI|nr:hypothetical protein LTR09_001682 [Extremus antarcticus]
MCLGVTAVSAGVAQVAVVGGTAVTYLKNAWQNGQCPAPIQATVPIGGGGKRSLEIDGSDLVKRSTLTGYNFEVTKGYDYNDCDYTLTDEDWGNTFQAITEYMVQYNDECIQVIIRGDDGFEANTLTWINTDDGVNHKTCG